MSEEKSIAKGWGSMSENIGIWLVYLLFIITTELSIFSFCINGGLWVLYSGGWDGGASNHVLFKEKVMLFACQML